MTRPAEEPGTPHREMVTSTESGLQACYRKAPLCGAFPFSVLLFRPGDQVDDGRGRTQRADGYTIVLWNERCTTEAGGRRMRRSTGPIELADWELLTDALVGALGNVGSNVDELRRAIESMPPESYETASYYERWLFAMETILTEKGVLAPGEIDARLAV